MNELVSPLIQQYLEIKSQYPEELIFFQVGDFYELFFNDAKIAASILSITLTKRGIYQSEHIPLCGIPVHMVEQYYPKLIKKGYTVIICDQVSEVIKPGKLVQRAVVDIITPSTIFIDSIEENIYSLFITINDFEITLFWFEFSKQEIIYAYYKNCPEDIILFTSSFEKHKPKEIMTNQDSIQKLYNLLKYKKTIKTVSIFKEEANNINNFIKKNNLNQSFFNVSNIFLSYLNRYFKNILEGDGLLVKKDQNNDYLFLDDSTIKYLECVNNLEKNEKENTIYELLDFTKTKMGSRMLQKWILYPLCNKDHILKRQEYIQFFVENKKIRETLQDYIHAFGDAEKLFQRIRLNKWRNKDFQTLLHFQKSYIALQKYTEIINHQFLNNFINFSIRDDFSQFILNSINNDYNLKINEEIIIIKPSFNECLEKKYYLLAHQEDAIIKFCELEKQTTGIPDLSIKKSQLYQYVFELSKVKEKKYQLPDAYIRVQTLTQKERYTSAALQKLSHEIINAQEEYINEENKIKKLLIEKCNQNIPNIYEFIENICTLDVYLSLAQAADEYHWTKPTVVNKGEDLEIINGKHPIAGKHNMMYIANSLLLNKNKKTYLITGPNMGGKSTYMRQNAILILLTHIGSYIPAKKSSIPIMEKILTRVGASDNLHHGKSTFYTELEDIKTILIAANQYSFIIVDEIGRGTSTYDGMAIAASTIEYIVEKNSYLLCSTHYHELHALINNNTIQWYSMNAIIKNNSISFLYNIIPGISDNSMGIALAKKIGLPHKTIEKAEEYFTKIQQALLNKNILEKKETALIIENKNKINEYDNLCNFYFKEKSMDDISPKEAHLILEKIYFIFKNNS